MTSKVAKALEAEANDDNVTFTHDGVTYTCPPMLEWEHEALKAVEQNRIATLVESVLRPEDLNKFLAKKPKMKDTIALAEALLAATGTSLEKSEG